MDDYNLEELDPNYKKSKHREILDEISNLDVLEFSDNSRTTITHTSFLPSSLLKEPKPKKKEEYDNPNYDPIKWYEELLESDITKPGKHNKLKNNIFDIGKKKKKKKKNKDGVELVDYKSEFEPEMALYKNLLMEQEKFTNSLQREYDSIKAVKSSSRGITKQMTDLVENITGARALAMQLVEKNVNAKKLIAELTLKQKKELGLTNNFDSANAAEFGTNYIKQLMNNRNVYAGQGGQDTSISDLSDDEMFSVLSDNLGDIERSDDGERFLRYENSNVSIYVFIPKNEDGTDDINGYEFIAKDDEGNDILDYPLPTRTSISVNKSTNIATDKNGRRYEIIWDNNDQYDFE